VGASTVTGNVLITGMRDQIVAFATQTGQVLWQAQQKPSQDWGGISISHGYVLSPTVGGTNTSGQLFCYRLPPGAG
jgi:hypothetical protein